MPRVGGSGGEGMKFPQAALASKQAPCTVSHVAQLYSALAALPYSEGRIDMGGLRAVKETTAPK